MDAVASVSTIDQKMAEMRRKNLELLKRHQEIEQDRQLAEHSSSSTTAAVEPLKDRKIMRGTAKKRVRVTPNQPNSQENQPERMHRPPMRRKIENDQKDTQPQRAQRVDYNRLKHERAQELNHQKKPNHSELQEYAYSFHYQSDNNHDADEPTHAKKLVIVNNKAGRIGSGRFNQQQRTQEQGQRKREERMRRCAVQTNGHTGVANEFHLDIPSMPIWQNGPMAPMHVQLLPTNITAHHTGIDHHLINSSNDQMDQSAYIHNFVYPSPVQPSSFNSNGTVYFTHPPPPPPQPPLTTVSPSSQTAQPHFHQYNPARTFENSNRHPFHPSTLFQPPTPNNYQPDEPSSADFVPRFRHLKTPERDNRLSQQRPMSGDFDRSHHNQHFSSSRFNHDNRYQARPQSFYDFSTYHQSNNNNHNNSFRSSNNNRYQRNNTMSLPLSAYMNTDDANENTTNNNNHWNNQKRRPVVQQRPHHQDKHQFPLSSYDPRQFGFNNNTYQRRNDSNRRSQNNGRYSNNRTNDSNDIDLIEEWWEDNNNHNELIGTTSSTLDTDSKMAAVNDSGNSSLSTSIHLKESTSEDFVNPPSDVSTTDSNIIESLDKLQQQLKLEEAVDERLDSTAKDHVESIEKKSNIEPTTYDTAHFMQWAKEKFREELAGRLTAQEIQQHDSVATDNDDDDDDDGHPPPTTDNVEKMDALEDDLTEKLTIDENATATVKSIAVE